MKLALEKFFLHGYIVNKNLKTLIYNMPSQKTNYPMRGTRIVHFPSDQSSFKIAFTDVVSNSERKVHGKT
jgi:hypothetical protein